MTTAWPPLPLREWQDTKDTLHLWTQIVGKVRLALAPMVNHWWQVALYVTARGLTTSAMPYRGRLIQIEFDLLRHELVIQRDGGEMRAIALRPRAVAEFYRDVMNALRELAIEVHIWTRPSEVAE